MAARKKARGSEKLLKGSLLNEAELTRLAKLTRSAGVKVVDWCVLGQPGPDGVCGSVHVRRALAGRFVNELLKLRRLRLDFEIFPIGIPVPNLYEIRFRRR